MGIQVATIITEISTLKKSPLLSLNASSGSSSKACRQWSGPSTGQNVELITFSRPIQKYLVALWLTCEKYPTRAEMVLSGSPPHNAFPS